MPKTVIIVLKIMDFRPYVETGESMMNFQAIIRIRAGQPEVTTAPRVMERQLPLYRVILHNDNNTMVYVVMVLQECFSLPEADAVGIMLTAHTEGSAVVVIEPLERAQFHSGQLQTYGLTASIEPAQ